jgi:membrane fusion protein (multidrug efflux system)
MEPLHPQNNKPPFKFTGERLALMIGGTLIGALAIVFSFKLATPIVKKACQSILEAPDKGERDVRLASIEAIVVKPGTISRRITTVGQLRANESVTLRTEMAGKIKEIAFKEGAKVKKGDILLRFDDEELKAQLDKAEADVEYRQVRFGRFESLQTKGLGRGTEFDQERGQLNMAKAELEVAKAKLAKATITAPFEGKIGLIDVSVGAYVDSQKELVTLVDFDPMKIDFKIPEKFIHDIGVGQTAEVKLDSFPDVLFQANVEAIDSRVDPQTHSIAVRATIPNEDGKLQTGLFGSVGVIIGVKNDALLVPESALGREGDIEYVWVVVNGKAGRKRVLTSTKENGQAEITAGLRAGEIVVTSGQLKLGEGMAVKISNMGDGDVELTDEDEDEATPKSPAISNKQVPKPSPETESGKDEPKPAGEEAKPKQEEPKTTVEDVPSEKSDAKTVTEETKPSPQESTKLEASDSVKPDSSQTIESKLESEKKVESLASPKLGPDEKTSNESIILKESTEKEDLSEKKDPLSAPHDGNKDYSPEAVKPLKADTSQKEEAMTDSVKSSESLEQTTKNNVVKDKDEPSKVTISPHQDKSVDSEKSLGTPEEKSFFSRSRDYVVNLFKRN